MNLVIHVISNVQPDLKKKKKEIKNHSLYRGLMFYLWVFLDVFKHIKQMWI